MKKKGRKTLKKTTQSQNKTSGVNKLGPFRNFVLFKLPLLQANGGSPIDFTALYHWLHFYIRH